MMGAFARIYGSPSIEALAAAIEEEMPAKRAENARAARLAYESVSFSGSTGEAAS
jgi:Pyruvate/2-oxoacid:ferredoxin oxidoreductase gamma subunit